MTALSQPKHHVPRVLVIKGPDEGKQFELTEPALTVGRESTNRIRLHDTEVSRRHAEFRLTDDGVVFLDVGSANGSFVNGLKVQQATLRSGDQILVGQTTLVYSAGRPDQLAARDAPGDDLSGKISIITRADVELSSAIIKTIGETEGSRILAQPRQTSAWVQNALANLSIMYEASQAVSKILDLGEMLDRILELVFGSIIADRGCFMLVDSETGELKPLALRWRKDTDREEKFALSKTITDHVLKNREGVLVSDAAQDERFNTGQSVVRLGIREVICVPMKGRHETLGVLYLDTHQTAREAVQRDTTGKFTEDHLALAIALAHQAALAVEETRYHQALLQAERLAAIGQTIAAVSHHIKNILQGLRSGSEILKMGLDEKNDRLIQQGWRVAEKNQTKIYNLVMDMLSYSKEREPTVEPANLNDIVTDVLELLAGRAGEAHIALETRLAADPPSIAVDPEGIHRALLNVLGNAFDAVAESTTPSITVSTSFGADGWAHIVVADNGVGIAPGKLEEIFKPFVSTKGSKGTGLGLAVSRKILREHGGDIFVESQLGVGSTFSLTVPLKSPWHGDPAATGSDMPILPPEPN